MHEQPNTHTHARTRARARARAHQQAGIPNRAPDGDQVVWRPMQYVGAPRGSLRGRCPTRAAPRRGFADLFYIYTHVRSMLMVL